MDLNRALGDLREELQRVNAAIASLERLKSAGPKRGRPPKLPAKPPNPGTRERKKET